MARHPTETDPDEAGDALGRDTLFRNVLGLVVRLFGTIVGSVRVLVLIAAVLAVVDVALLVVASRDLAQWWLAALVALPIALIPAFLLDHVRRRFVACRDALTTVGARLPDVVHVPQQVMGPMAQIGDQAEDSADQGRIRRLISTARILLRFKRVFNDVVDKNRELVDAGWTVVTYGPRDVLLATWGALAIVGLAVAVPVLALAAILTA